MSFDVLGLAEPLLRAVREQGYDTPTPIQRQAIPAVLAGGDPWGLNRLDNPCGPGADTGPVIGPASRSRQVSLTYDYPRQLSLVYEHQFDRIDLGRKATAYSVPR